uniref:Uncharacterized protein n=1 Tax=Aegilops tauschii TaxID=37682 RepID=M8C5F5_AEGTA
MTQRQQRFCSLSFFYARHYPQNVVRCGHQTTVFRMPRSETEATRAALTCWDLLWVGGRLLPKLPPIDALRFFSTDHRGMCVELVG